MPLYEYRCPQCEKTFERKSTIADRNRSQSCPHCQRPAPRVEMSRVAVLAGGLSVSGGSSAHEAPMCGSGACCGGGACDLN